MRLEEIIDILGDLAALNNYHNNNVTCAPHIFPVRELPGPQPVQISDSGPQEKMFIIFSRTVMLMRAESTSEYKGCT